MSMLRGIPKGAKLRVVGDVHGDAAAFAYAVATDRFVVQLGDLTDGGKDSARTLRLMFELIDAGRGMFMLGNHELKLARSLAGRPVKTSPELAATLAQLDPALARRTAEEIARAPAWARQGDAFFVHAGFHTAMLNSAPPQPGEGRVEGVLARALYGEVTGQVLENGFPERRLDWIDRVPAGLTVYVGHDTRSTDGRPWVRKGAAGGTAVFLDTGAGKGGHLSWIDLPPGA